MKKLILQEELLNEAFSPSMPDWLRAWFLGNKDSDLPLANRNQYARWYDKDLLDKRSDFSGPRGHSGNYNNAMSWAKQNNIDLNKATFIQAQIPKKRDDALMTYPNQPFFYLKNDQGEVQVYAPGINDNEDSIFSGKNGYIKSKYLSPKMLRDNAVDFVYVNMSDPKNKNDQSKATRAQSNQVTKDLKSKGLERTSEWSRDKDRSGYIVNPNKYTKELEKRKAGKYADKLEDLYDDLVRLKDMVSSAYDDVDISDESTLDNYQAYIQTFKNSIRDYNRLLERVNRLKNQFGSNQDAFMEQIANLFGRSGDYAQTKNSVDNLKKNLENYNYTIFEW